MADIPSDGFAKSLEKFRLRLSDDEKQIFSSGSVDEVKAAMRQIQDRLGPEKKLRGFTRIRKFLEGMKQVEQLVKIFLNVHEVVAFVWVCAFDERDKEMACNARVSLTRCEGPHQTCSGGEIYRIRGSE